MKKALVYFLILLIFLTAGKNEVTLKPSNTLTVSALSIERKAEHIELTLETISNESDKNVILSFKEISTEKAVEKADNTLAYSLIFSHCSAVILRGEILKEDIEALLKLVSVRLLPLSSVVVYSDEEILTEDKSSGYSLKDYFELKGEKNYLYSIMSQYYSLSKITLPDISKEKEGYKWKSTKELYPL